ncbi:MAG TPA: polysaccharide deacetylase family protein [Solirubrobacterales bacterium]|nr:polysaccharide deacetylase family protein [Solirubrobacterales bacterium]
MSEPAAAPWCEAPWRTRLARRLPLIGRLARLAAPRSQRWRQLADDLAFWEDVRGSASDEEWRRLTSSYAVLVYHRFAGELKPGQERIDLDPRRFRRQLRLLRALGFKPLPLEDLLAFHGGERNDLPRRRFVITADDAMADAVEPLRRAAGLAPQLFVPTAEVGKEAHWIDGEPVASWEEVRSLAAAGVAIGSHTRHHRRLSQLGPTEREVELVGSLAELREQVPGAAAVIAYPNGDHDDAVCEATRAAGYALAYTTEKGRNGAATDPFRLRRVSVHGADGALAVLWKVLTGDALPSFWLRLRR